MTWDARQLAQQVGRTFVVTGAARGRGLETARDLVGRGAHVVLAVRDVDQGEQVRRTLSGRGSTSVVELDLSDLDSVASCAKTLLDAHDSLAAVVCTAGVAGGPHRLSPQGVERQMATEHLGRAALVAGLWPVLRSSAARVVVVADPAARRGRLSAGTTLSQLVDPSPYDARQACDDAHQATLLFALELHRRCSRAGVPVSAVAVHPGVPATSPQDDGDAALPTLRALDHSTPSGSYVGPARSGSVQGRAELLDVPPSAADPATAARLWELTEQVLGTPLPV